MRSAKQGYVGDVPSTWRSDAERLAKRTVIRAARAFPWARDVILHEFGNPTLTDLYLTPASWHEHASSVVAELFPRRSAHEFADEFTPVMEMIRGRVDERRAMLRYPDYSAIEEETARLLYSLVRVAQPETVLETGVGNGVSSAIFLAALDANGGGRLHSVDVAGDVGELVGTHPRWHLHLTHRGAPLDAIAEEVGDLDLFFHDSHHSYDTQMGEFIPAWRHLRPGGLLITDDADHSFAFVDFCKREAHQSMVLLDRRKVTGVMRR
jgi:predicted O-methyltransferase YrrM